MFLRAQSDNQQKFTVSGTVVNSATNEPVGGALVEIVSSERKSVLAGPDGHFQIDGITAASAAITARRPGFDQPDNHQQVIKVGSGMDAVTVKLTPLSRISGRISDSEGEPIEGVFVRCITQQIVNGRKQWQPQGGATTDESGSFALEDLRAGTYVLATQEKQLYFTSPKSEAARYVYPPTFYPDSSSRDLAQRIVLAAGGEMRADITLHAIRGARLTLTTVPAIQNVMASLTHDDEPFDGNQTETSQSAQLIFTAVPPGLWKVIAQAGFGPRPQQAAETIYGETEVEVGSADIDNLKLPMGRLADIPVIVSGAANTEAYVQLHSKQGMMVNGSNPEPGGELKIHSVTPGTYRVVIPFNFGDHCVTSVMYGTQDLLHDDLVVSTGASPAPIQITTDSHCADLTINSNGTGLALITSSSPAFEPRVVPIGARYVSDFKSFPPGDYKIYAFDDTTNLEFANTDAMRDFKSQSVHLEADQKATVQLEINERKAK